MIKIRTNPFIKYIIIHHTGHVDSITIDDINNEYLQVGNYSIPYDLVIDKNGFINLTSRWIRSQKRGIIEKRVDISKIFKYREHFYSDISPIYYSSNSLNIAVIGNYDIERPNSLVFNTLINILQEIINKLDLSLHTSLLYYNEIFGTTSPGVFFFDKSYLIKFVKKKLITRPVSVPIVVDGGGILPPYEPPVVITRYRLTEDLNYRITESGERRRLENNT
jgi:hypothetical protein